MASTTTTQVQVTDDQVVTAFFIAVEETQFVQQHLDQFKNKTWAIMTEYIMKLKWPDIMSNNMFQGLS